MTAMQAQRPQGVASQQFAFPLKCLKMMFAIYGHFRFSSFFLSFFLFLKKNCLILHFYLLFKNFTSFLQERY